MSENFVLNLKKNLLLKPKVATKVNWCESNIEKNSFWSKKNPSIINLPYDAKIRFFLGVSFSSDKNGMRQAWITQHKNNKEPFLGYPTPTSKAVDGNSSTSFSSLSPLIKHKKGDEFEMYVYHNSCNELFLRGSYATWLEIEYLKL